jgi:phosphoglycerol transferase MdoB-like AlkP superfamily enzyme
LSGIGSDLPIHHVRVALTGPIGTFAAVFLGISSATRLVLALSTGAQGPPFAQWPAVFVRGVGFDLAVLAWAIAPLLLYEAVLPARVRAWRGHGGLRDAGFFAVTCLLLFAAVAEWTFWQEFSARFNFIALDYLLYSDEVVGNVRESYPVAPILVMIAALALGSTWAVRARLRAADRDHPARRARVVYALLALTLPALSFLVADIDRMAFSGDVYANELSGNGLMTLAAALRRNELDYDRFYRTMPDGRAAAVLAELGVERVLRELHADAHDETWDPGRMPFSAPPRHVVLISVESLSARFLGAFGDARRLTPRLDGLAGDGLLFTRLYATGTRTVRGLEALSLGTPPLPGQAIVRRPGNDHLATLGEILRGQGYATLFVYGGYGYFDNMNAFFSGNDYRVVDRTAFPRASVVFANIWGVADESLFDNALAEIDRAHAGHRPFLAHIMTTSNHRPFTYPQGRVDIPSPGGRDGAVKYTDYAIGRFIDMARSRPWFSDTLFVIVADHTAGTAGRTRLPVPGYHIPMIFYSPALLPPGRIDRVVSQLDVPPTVLDVLGLPGDDHFFGQSVFEQGHTTPRAFVSSYQELGYYKNDTLIVLGPKKRAEAFAIDPRTGEATPAAMNARLLDEAVAYYQSAFRAFKRGELKLP